jgi:hypothetical protein
MPSTKVEENRRIPAYLASPQTVGAKGFYNWLASSSPGRAASVLTLGLLLLPTACKTALTVHRDAGQARKDVATPDPAAKDLGSPDETTGVPSGFRFENHTQQTVYVRVDSPVACRMQTASGWQDCSFFELSCMLPCADVQVSQACCVQCGQLAPALYAIPLGGSRTVPWTGNLYTKTTGLCLDCECSEEGPAANGELQASARVFADYECSFGPCQTSPDGKIEMASPRGSASELTVPFTVPMADDLVIIAITALPTNDAAVTPDAASVDVRPAKEAGTDLLPGPFADLPGQVFRIAANAANPDASLDGRSCKPADDTEVYLITFADDGWSVSIQPGILQEEPLLGTLKEETGTRLRYDIDAFAGGELEIHPDGSGGLVARLAIFGSGVPVVLCMEAPLIQIP